MGFNFLMYTRSTENNDHDKSWITDEELEQVKNFFDYFFNK
jgi:hypothetical protein